MARGVGTLSVPHILNEVQQCTSLARARYARSLWETLEADPDALEQLAAACEHIVAVEKKSPCSTRLVTFLGAFAGFADSDQRLEVVEALLTRLQPLMLAVAHASRWRACQISAALMLSLPGGSALDEDVADDLEASLLVRMRDARPPVRAAAACALGALLAPEGQEGGGGAAFEAILAAAEADPAREVRRAAVSRLPSGAPALRALRERARDQAEDVRADALRALAAVVDDELAHPLDLWPPGAAATTAAAALADPSPRVVRAGLELAKAWLEASDEDAVEVLDLLGFPENAAACEAILAALLGPEGGIEACVLAKRCAELVRLPGGDDADLHPDVKASQLLAWRLAAASLRREAAARGRAAARAAGAVAAIESSAASDALAVLEEAAPSAVQLARLLASVDAARNGAEGRQVARQAALALADCDDLGDAAARAEARAALAAALWTGADGADASLTALGALARRAYAGDAAGAARDLGAFVRLDLDPAAAAAANANANPAARSALRGQALVACALLLEAGAAASQPARRELLPWIAARAAEGGPSRRVALRCLGAALAGAQEGAEAVEVLAAAARSDVVADAAQAAASLGDVAAVHGPLREGASRLLADVAAAWLASRRVAAVRAPPEVGVELAAGLARRALSSLASPRRPATAGDEVSDDPWAAFGGGAAVDLPVVALLFELAHDPSTLAAPGVRQPPSLLFDALAARGRSGALLPLAPGAILAARRLSERDPKGPSGSETLKRLVDLAAASCERDGGDGTRGAHARVAAALALLGEAGRAAVGGEGLRPHALGALRALRRLPLGDIAVEARDLIKGGLAEVAVAADHATFAREARGAAQQLEVGSRDAGDVAELQETVLGVERAMGALDATLPLEDWTGDKDAKRKATRSRRVAASEELLLSEEEEDEEEEEEGDGEGFDAADASPAIARRAHAGVLGGDNDDDGRVHPPTAASPDAVRRGAARAAASEARARIQTGAGGESSSEADSDDEEAEPRARRRGGARIQPPPGFSDDDDPEAFGDENAITPPVGKPRLLRRRSSAASRPALSPL